jgi:hypothetical protein
MTVWIYSFSSTETFMIHQYRQHYRPTVSRMPEWLWQVWLWL